MIENIAILISGNPVSSSGVRRIGGIGMGLSIIDPAWPSTAQGKFALIIADKGKSSNYCLMFPPRLISSSGANRGGALNIQLQIPHGKVLADAEDRLVSPFSMLQMVFNHYKEHHLIQYPGVDGWSYADDWEMKAEEFDSLLAPYKLIDRVLPARHLNGTGEAFIAMPTEKMAQFTLDHAYPELVDYGKVIISTDGATNPPGLARLQVPRRPMFEIYVNGIKQDGLVSEGDEAFNLTITPPNPSYQKSATVKVDFNKALAERIVDQANERINYTVDFEDLKYDWTVKVVLKGLEGEGSRDKIMKELLGALYLENQAARGYQPADRIYPNGRITNPLVFTLKGKQIISSWELKWDKLPENVHKGEVKSLFRGFEVAFIYKKPEDQTDDQHIKKPKPEPVPKPAPKKETVELPVYITGNDTDDKKIKDLLNSIKFNVILEPKSNITLVLRNIVCNSRDTEQVKHEDKNFTCYKCAVEFPAYYLSKLRSENNINVKSLNGNFRLWADFNKDNSLAGNNSYIIVFAEKVPMKNLIWDKVRGKVMMLVLLIGCLLLGSYLGEVFTPWAKIAGKEKAVLVPDPKGVVEDAFVDDDQPLDTAVNGSGSAGGDAIGGGTGGTDGTGNGGGESAGSVNLNDLKADAVNYMKLIESAEMTFAQVDEINNWVAENKSYGSRITNYNTIKTAIGEYVKCRNLLNKVKPEADFVELSEEFKKLQIQQGELLLALRQKMQKFTIKYVRGKAVLLEKDEIANILYTFDDNHPDGIDSFAVLPK